MTQESGIRLHGASNVILVTPCSSAPFRRPALETSIWSYRLTLRNWFKLRSGHADQGIRFPLPSRECVELCDDKLKFNQRLIEEGFGAHVPRIGRGPDWPYILKKRIGVCGRECRIIRDVAEESAVRKQIDDPDYFCQEVIRGTQEYATHILFANTRIVKSLNIEYRFETDTPVKGKDKSLTRTICACPYLDLFGDVLHAIGFQGLCCVNYKVRDGLPYIIEINPRFGASLAPYFFSFLRHLSR
jgi:predicted ATP-grasp superfamily ATP-dependent carboligase